MFTADHFFLRTPPPQEAQWPPKFVRRKQRRSLRLRGPDDATISEGETYESSVAFTDPGADEWTATVDYRDGSDEETLEDVGRTFDLSHTYSGNGSGPFTVTITVTDDDRGTGSNTAQVTVVYAITVDKATVNLNRRGRWPQDRFDAEGTLPTSLIERFDSGDVVSVDLAGLVLDIPAGAVVRQGRGRKARWL